MVPLLEVPIPLAMTAPPRRQKDGLKDGIRRGVRSGVLIIVDSDACAHGQPELLPADTQEILDLSRPDLRARCVLIQAAGSRTSGPGDLAPADFDNSHGHFVSHPAPLSINRQGQAELSVRSPVPIQDRDLAVDPLDQVVNDDFLLARAVGGLFLQTEDSLERSGFERIVPPGSAVAAELVKTLHRRLLDPAEFSSPVTHRLHGEDFKPEKLPGVQEVGLDLLIIDAAEAAGREFDLVEIGSVDTRRRRRTGERSDAGFAL